MWAVLLQLLAVAAGWQVIRQLPVKWRRTEALAASVAVGFAVVPWWYLVVVAIVGWRVGLPLATAGLALAVAASWRWATRRAELTSTGYSQSHWRMLGWLVAGAVVIVVTNLVILSYQFPGPQGDWVSNGNVWGDAPLHVALTNQFAHGDKLDLISPVYKRVILTYPLIADFWSGVLMRFTTNWYLGLMLPSAVLILALLQLLFSFAYRVTRSGLAAWLAWLMLVFSGSLQGGCKLAGIWLTQGYQAYRTTVGNSFAFATGDNYLNFLHSHPLPQRSYGFGMALALVVGIVALELYRRRHQSAGRSGRRLGGVIAGGLLGLMPLVHTHSFMVMVGVLGLATLALWLWERRLPAGWWQMAAIGLAVAAPQVIWQFTATFHSGFTHWIWGWMMANFVPVQQNWFVYWFHNVGLLFGAILLGWAWLWRRRQPAELWLLYVAAVAIFLICNVYVFQPSMWDNMKFFEYSFWMIMVVLGAAMADLAKRLWGKVVVAAAMVTLCLMGVFTLAITGSSLTFQLLSADDVAFGHLLAQRLPQDAYILVGDRHNSPVTMLGDRKVFMTFAGWYNLYDGQWPTTYADRGVMLTGADGAAELIARYGLTFAAFSNDEIANSEVSLGFFQSHYPLFYEGQGWWVFDLRRPL